MVLHDDARRLLHMLEHTLEAIALAEGRSQAELKQDRLLQLALTRLIEIIGEAAARVSSSAQAQCIEIPWPQIISMRNRLIHGYDAVDLEVLWKTVVEDLPALAAVLSRATADQHGCGASASATDDPASPTTG